MRLFLLVFFVIYGSFHVYAFLRARAGFTLSRGAWIFIALFMLIMVLAPVLIHMSEKAGYSSFARFLSFVGYLWLGVLFLFVSFSLVIDMYRIMVHLGGIVLSHKLSALMVPPRQAFLIPLIVSLAIACYGYFEARDIRTEKIVIKTNKIRPETGKIRIVQISDVHVGLIVRDERLKTILSKVKEAEPDILISTGDLVDGELNDLDGLVNLFSEISPRFGKFAVTGNHEFYAGLTQALAFTRKAGFTVLRGEHRNIQGILNIAGIDDMTAEYFGERIIPEEDLLASVDSGLFTIFLKHRPLISRKSLGLFDLQLSGHVHKGQIFPFSIITGLYYETQSGFAKLSSNASLYVSRGSGTWGPPIRFLSPPEVTVIDLVATGAEG